ncbi:MAG: apolipoprotein N-acyltransferase [Victivallaceae bacterium]
MKINKQAGESENNSSVVVEVSENELKKNREGNEAWRIRFSTKLGAMLVLFASGMLMSASVPPLNWSVAAWFSLIPFYWLAAEKRAWTAWGCGYIWGLGWGFTAFFWLREINPVIPYLMAPVLALFTAFWAMAIPLLRRGLLIPVETQLRGYDAERQFNAQSPWRELFFALALAAWWCIIEWSRSRMLPWNYLAVSQWRNLALIQICEYTSTYGVSFLIVLTNVAIALAVKTGISGFKNHQYRRPVPFMVTLIILMLVSSIGGRKLFTKPEKSPITFNAGLIQGNISQRRMATNAEAKEALDIYLKLSYELAAEKPDIIIWPETAVPYPYRASHPLCRDYRFRLQQLISATKIPMLIGTIDFEDLPPGVEHEPGVLNSAFLFSGEGIFQSKFDKVNPVPFGEYVPFRRFLPQWAIKAIDMNRDLTAGKSFSPLPVYPGVKAGINICFEDIFPYVSRKETLEGANMLLTITNDAWYPTSSEPEQHLANSVFRSVETGLPMIRCGNNSASCLINPNGFISQCILQTKDPKTGKMQPAPEIRGRQTGIIKVSVKENPPLTFYSRYGDIFILFCWLLFIAASLVSAGTWYNKKSTLLKAFE